MVHGRAASRPRGCPEFTPKKEEAILKPILIIHLQLLNMFILTLGQVQFGRKCFHLNP